MKRRRKCLYPNCNHSDLIKKCNFYMFPKSTAITQQWLNLCGITSLTARRSTSSKYICSCHFEGNEQSNEDQFPMEYIEEFDDQEMDVTCHDPQSDDSLSLGVKRPKCEDDSSSRRREAAEVLFPLANEFPKRVKYLPKAIFWRMRAANIRAIKKVKLESLLKRVFNLDAMNTTITLYRTDVTRDLSSQSADVNARETKEPEALVCASIKLPSNIGVNAELLSSHSLSSMASSVKIVGEYVGNQKFGLCEALLSIDAWSIVKELCEKLPDNFLMEQPIVSNAMCKLLHIVIDPLYKKECFLGPQMKGRPVSLQEIVLDPYIFIDPVLLAKLVGICKSTLSKILFEIQLYDTLILSVVDLPKYLTSLSYDVLAHCLVECLTQADKDKDRNHNGFSVSLWVQSLSSFCGSIFKKYNVDLSGLLQYVANQLKAQRSLDLIILKEIVVKTAGIEAAGEMTAEQLDAMAGGELLEGKAAYFSQVRNTKKSSMCLREALSDQNLAVALCLSMAQPRYCVMYHETEISQERLCDQAQDTLVHSGTFLGMNMSVEECVTRLPPIDSLLSTYNLNTDEAFFLSRPMFNHAITIRYDTLCKSDPNVKELSVVQKQQKYVEAVAEVMGPIVESIKPLHPIEIWEAVSPQFFVTFWSLTMYDLHVPVDAYQRQIIKLKVMAYQTVDSRDVPSSISEKEQERYLLALADKLQDEKMKQQDHVDRVLSRLCHEKDNWFLSRFTAAAKTETITKFLQLFLLPRCIFTMVDAMYCAKFVETIHSLRTANFRTLLCYDRLFSDITYSVTSCTENEANWYGLFLNSMLETVMRWHSDKSIFEKECASYPGFVTKYRVSGQSSEACNQVGYEEYRHVCQKWQYLITKAMVVSLDSEDYVLIRNCLIILRNIFPHFPVLIKLGHIIRKKIEKLCEEEKNQHQDLTVMAKSYVVALKDRSMIPESSFHLVADKQVCQELSNQKPLGGSLGGVTSETPQPVERSESGKSVSEKSAGAIGKENTIDYSSRNKKVAADPVKKKRQRGEMK